MSNIPHFSFSLYLLLSNREWFFSSCLYLNFSLVIFSGANNNNLSHAMTNIQQHRSFVVRKTVEYNDDRTIKFILLLPLPSVVNAFLSVVFPFVSCLTMISYIELITTTTTKRMTTSIFFEEIDDLSRVSSFIYHREKHL